MFIAPTETHAADRKGSGSDQLSSKVSTIDSPTDSGTVGTITDHEAYCVASQDLPMPLPSSYCPRILMICRSEMRKNKPIDYTGEYHIEWVQKFGGVPVIVPRTPATLSQLEHYLPMDGLLLVEAVDLSPEYKPYGSREGQLDEAVVAAVVRKHPSDTAYDQSKDQIEWQLLTMAMEQNVPVFGVCRGCQMLNVAYGGSLYFYILSEVPKATPHISYEQYDNYRHSLRIVPNTPLAKYYELEIGADAKTPIQVNSYHHQGIRDLASRLSAMAYSAEDGVIEGFYDPSNFNPDEGQFCLGLQFHPERLGMQAHQGAGLKVYEAFISAARHFGMKRRLMALQ